MVYKSSTIYPYVVAPKLGAAWLRDSERSERQQAIHWLGEAEADGAAEGVAEGAAEGAAGPLDTNGASRPTSAGESPEASSTP